MCKYYIIKRKVDNMKSEKVNEELRLLKEQYEYACYAVTNDLKRWKMYHKEYNQWRNFKNYVDYHRETIRIKNLLEDNYEHFNAFKNRKELESIIINLARLKHSDFPNLYHYEMIRLSDDFDKFFYNYKLRLTSLSLNIESVIDSLNVELTCCFPSTISHYIAREMAKLRINDKTFQAYITINDIIYKLPDEFDFLIKDSESLFEKM